MLKSSSVLLMMRAATALRATGKADDAALAADLDATAQAAVASRAAVAANRQRGQGSSAGKPPSIAYVVEQEPGDIACAMGAKAAHALLDATLAKLGARTCPKPRSLAAMLSTQGQWMTLVDTDNGTVAVTVRKATAAEAVEFGTPLA